MKYDEYYTRWQFLNFIFATKTFLYMFVVHTLDFQLRDRAVPVLFLPPQQGEGE